jgi:hypothetical protein
LLLVAVQPIVAVLEPIVIVSVVLDVVVRSTEPLVLAMSP